MRFYFYWTEDKKGIIRIESSKRPSLRNRRPGTTWVVQELTPEGFQMPVFPEITWWTLQKQTYIGSVEAK